MLNLFNNSPSLIHLLRVSRCFWYSGHVFVKRKNIEKSFFPLFCHTCVNVVDRYLDRKKKSDERALQIRLRCSKYLGKFGVKILDWLVAFFWAAIWVFLINQYFLQAYMIPSESMIPTLLIGDRVFVNKLIAGPELLPGMKKLPSLKPPQRGEVIIFSNPELKSGGTFFQIVHRIVYMLSFSMIDLGGQESLAQLLIKRAVGSGGDYIIFRNGDLYIRPKGLKKFYDEAEFQNMTSLSYPVQRLVSLDKDKYDHLVSAYRAYQTAFSMSSYPLDSPFPSEYQELKKKITVLQNFHSLNPYVSYGQSSWDIYLATLYKLMPHDRNIKKQYLRSSLGYYVPPGNFFPLGDNRDNSRDGRYFGTIPSSQVLGYSVWKFYPFNRMGKVI